MKKIIAGAFALSLFVISCKKETKTESSISTDTLATVIPKDSIASSETDSTAIPSASAYYIITKNVGKYPHDIKFFEDKRITERLRKLTGAQYDEMVKNFDVESPISSENGIYKLTGCKQHDCPGFATSIYYDAKNDKVSVSIDKNGKVTNFDERKLYFKNH
ncbi:hypothetical protein [Chryseobacterium sp. MA9]|uniref:hypothetical protein n=1 Tax=Chryseobacterium sp. MA9 TaxID=2966625 RepID=UPI0021056601|nr:hypothetical protein [Chryseobacterium sp. MA9]UTX48194.1 hypothetical protein KIK00_20135 [Chryseobacterium sp. MA9]